MHLRHRTGGTLVALVALVGLTAAACGSNSKNDSNASADRTTTTLEDTTTTSELGTTTTSELTPTTAAGVPTTLDQGTTTTTARPRATTTTAKPRGTTTTVKKPGSTTSTTVGLPIAKGTIKLGTIGTSVQATTGAKTTDETRKIAEAWATQTNRAGGINGYKVEIVYKDGQGDTARTLQAVKDLDKAGVLAIAGQGVAQTLSGAAAYIRDNKVPIVGGTPYTPEFDTDQMWFPVSASYYAGVYGQVAAARDAGAKYFRNMYCTEVAACAQAVPVTNEAAQREGMKGDAVGASARAVDYSAPCIDGKNKGVDFMQLNGMNVPTFVRDCSRQNYHPIYAVGGAASQGTIDDTQGERLVGNLYEFGAFYNGPEVQRFRQATQLTDLQLGSTVTQTGVQTWLGFEMAGAVLKKLVQPSPTRADFLNALYTIKGETLGGQSAPLDYTTQRLGAGNHSVNDCWTEHTVVDGKFVHMNKSGQAVNKLTFICGTGHKYG